MKRTEPPIATLRAATVVVVSWTFLALLFLPQTYFMNLGAPTPLSWGQALAAILSTFYLWALLTPAVVWMGGRFPLERGRLAGSITVHLIASFVFAAAHLLMLDPIQRLVVPMQNYRPPMPLIPLLLGMGATNVMLYWGVVAVGHALAYFRRYQDRELRLVEAQLQSLKTQLHPHFLFNSLNAIAELIHEDAHRAEQAVTRLSDLLRMALISDGRQEVALAEEVDFARKYLAMQKTLLEERLNVRWDLDEVSLGASVPSMLLQPLVENAIRHGLSGRKNGGSIEIAAKVDQDVLRVRVDDDGAGTAVESGEPKGLGLANTRARLRHLYGDAQTMDAGPRVESRGFSVSIALPYREWRSLEG